MIFRPAAALLLLAACSTEPGREAAAPPPAPAAVAAAPAPPAAPVAPAPPTTPAPVAAPTGPALAVEAEGLRLFDRATGSASPIPFGRPQAAMLEALERLRGPARPKSLEEGVNADCGAGPVRYASWPDGLSLVFQDGRFAGWSLDARAAGALSTANGIAPGITRTQLEAASTATFRRTTLGTEFDAGGLYGVLDGPGPRARITDMWAGVSCVAR